MFAAIALSLLSAASGDICTRYTSATETVTVCRHAPDAPATIWVYVRSIKTHADGYRWATVCYRDTGEEWIVPAWFVTRVGGRVGHTVQISASIRN